MTPYQPSGQREGHVATEGESGMDSLSGFSLTLMLNGIEQPRGRKNYLFDRNKLRLAQVVRAP